MRQMAYHTNQHMLRRSHSFLHVQSEIHQINNILNSNKYDKCCLVANFNLISKHCRACTKLKSMPALSTLRSDSPTFKQFGSVLTAQIYLCFNFEASTSQLRMISCRTTEQGMYLYFTFLWKNMLSFIMVCTVHPSKFACVYKYRVWTSLFISLKKHQCSAIDIIYMEGKLPNCI